MMIVTMTDTDWIRHKHPGDKHVEYYRRIGFVTFHAFHDGFDRRKPYMLIVDPLPLPSYTKYFATINSCVRHADLLIGKMFWRIENLGKQKHE